MANAAGILSGWMDSDLTSNGEEQARLLGELLVPYPIDFVLSSDLTRAHRTAEIALARRAELRGEHPPDIIQDRRLRERNFGPHQGRLKSELRAEGLFEKITDWDSHLPNVLSYSQLRDIVLPTLQEYSTTKNPILFAHGGVLRALSGPESIYRKVPNAQIFDTISLSERKG